MQLAPINYGTCFIKYISTVYPSAVTDIKASATSAYSIRLTWQKPEDLDDPDYGVFKCYLIHLQQNNSQQISIHWHRRKSTSMDINYLKENTFYGIRVQVLTQQGYGKLSDKLFVKTWYGGEFLSSRDC